MKIEILFSIPCSRNYFRKKSNPFQKSFLLPILKNIMKHDEGKRQ
jgi:hypothetical protein